MRIFCINIIIMTSYEFYELSLDMFFLKKQITSCVRRDFNLKTRTITGTEV